MRIGLNATVFKNPLSGVGKRTVSLIRAAARQRPDHAWFLFSPGPVKRPDLGGVNVNWVEGTGGLESRWLHRRLPGLLRAHRIDVLEAPWGGGLPGGGHKPCPYVTTFHDTLPLDRQVWWGERLRYRLRAGADLKRADAVIAVSEDTRARLTRHFPKSEGKITVIPNGVDPGFGPPPAESIDLFRRTTLANLGLDSYFLYVGGYNPRKNVENLLRAFEARWGDGKNPDPGLKLVLAGHPNRYFESHIRPLLETPVMAARVALPGFLNEEDMALWYGAATGVCYPSLHEGFGMPVLEAMACGAPVLTHCEGPMLEFAEGVAVTADGRRVDALAEALDTISSGREPSPGALAQGIERARAYHWPDLARRYLEVLERAAAGSKGV